MFWHYMQTAPGSSGIIDNDNLTDHVIIEADTPLEANKIAEEKGIVFNNRECPCCEPRWEEFLETDIDMATETPCVCDEPIHNCEDRFFINDRVIIYYKDGRKEKTKVKLKGDK